VPSPPTEVLAYAGNYFSRKRILRLAEVERDRHAGQIEGLAQRAILPLCLPSCTESGRIYDYKTKKFL